MAIGFVGFGFMGWRGSRRTAGQPPAEKPEFTPFGGEEGIQTTDRAIRGARDLGKTATNDKLAENGDQREAEEPVSRARVLPPKSRRR
jgi:hypothetical protein